MAGFPLPASALPTFFLISVRCVAMLLVAPVFSARQFPIPARIGLALLLAALLTPAVGPVAPALEDWAFPGLVVQEALVGALLGLTAQVVFQALQMAAALIELQMGLSFASLIDPLGGPAGTVLANFSSVLAALIFFSFDGHHLMLLGLGRSLEVLPLGDPRALSLQPDRWIAVSAGALESALRLALPVSGALLLTDVAMGMLGRALPQMNVLNTSLPAKIAIGLFALAAALPVMASLFGARARALAEALPFVLGT